jgi:hypothetical protein
VSIEAPLSKYKRTNFKIYAAACLIFAAVFAYDGYLSKYEWSRRRSFYDKHVQEGKADDTMRFNQFAPIVLVVFVVILSVRFRALKSRKLLAEEKGLVIDGKEKIPYDSIESIDKTHFKTKGHFTVVYKDKGGGKMRRRFSDRMYENLGAILDHLVEKIT